MKNKRGIQKACLLAFLASIFTFYNYEAIGQVSANETQSREYHINKSVTDKGIAFTIHDVVKNGNELTLKYEIQSKTAVVPKAESNTSAPISRQFVYIEDPDVYINGKLLNWYGETSYKEVGKNQYRGTIRIRPAQNETILPESFDLKVNTDVLLEQEGQWTIKHKF